MKLHLLRHAKTDQYSRTGRDFDRELLPKGIKQCELLKPYFENITGIGRIWCSTAARTRQTLELVYNNSMPAPDFSNDLYLASYKAILAKLWNEKGSEDILIVGHNFGVSDIASYFTDEPIELRTGGYVCIEFPVNSWEETSKGLGTICDQYRPKVSL